MLDDIRKYVMHRLRDNMDNCGKWICDFGPRISKKMYDNGVESTLCHMLWNDDNGFKVEHKGDTYVVDLKNMTGPCQSWEFTRILYHHVIYAIHHIGKRSISKHMLT